MSCGSWCVYYKSRGKTSACTNCHDYEDMKTSRFVLGKIDLNKFHTIAIREVIQKIKHSIPQLSDCLYCPEHSLFYNSINDQFECLNPKCNKNKKPILRNTKDYGDVLNSLKATHMIAPVELTELEWSIYKNHLDREGGLTENYFEIIIKH